MERKKDVKLKDIAQELGVSVVSVSNALKGKKGVSEELRLKIQKKAGEMGYEILRTSGKKKREFYRIGVIVAERYVKEYPSFYMDIYKHIAQFAAKKSDLTLLEVVDEEKEKMHCHMKLFSGIEIQGIIVIGEMNSDFISLLLEEYQIPLVGVDFYIEGMELDFVIPDSFNGMKLVTQVLIDAGHKDIAFIGNPYISCSVMDRYMGYCRALKAGGLTERRDRVIFDRDGDGFGCVLDFELPDDMPTAFACNCDKTAWILMNKLKKAGIRVPEDVSIVGFDQFCPVWAENLELTTYENDGKALAQIGFNTLIKRIEKEKRPGGIRIVEGRLVEGSTVKSPAEKRRKDSR